MKNFSRGTLAQPITPSSDSLRVTITEPWQLPSAAGYVCLFGDEGYEIVRYRASAQINDNVIELQNITRGYEGSAARPWNAGEQAAFGITARALSTLLLEGKRDFVAVQNPNVGAQLVADDGTVGETLLLADCIAAAVDYFGDLVVLNGNALEKYRAGVRQWSITPFDPAREPTQIRIDQDNNIVVNGGDNTGSTRFITKYSPEGDKLWEYGFSNSLAAIEIDGDSAVYVVDGTNLTKITREGLLDWTDALAASFRRLAVSRTANILAVEDDATDRFILSRYKTLLGSYTAGAGYRLAAVDDGLVTYETSGQNLRKYTDGVADYTVQVTTAVPGISRAVLVNSGLIVCATSVGDDTLIGVDTSNGDVLWERPLDSPISRLQPISFHNCYVQRDDDVSRPRPLLARDLRSGDFSVQSETCFLEAVHTAVGNSPAGYARIYVDTDNVGKVKFSNGTNDTLG